MKECNLIRKIIKYVIAIFLLLSGSFLLPCIVSAHQPKLIYSDAGDIQINNPEISQAFYDELRGEPRNYFIRSDKDFDLYINLLVPEEANKNGRYSFNIFQEKDGSENLFFSSDTLSIVWSEFYEPFGRDYYLKGPEFDKQVSAGRYKIEVYSNISDGENQGEYVLAVGKIESFDVKSILDVYWQLPLLKVTFFKTSVLQFFFTPFGIAGVGAAGAILIFLAAVYYFVGLVREIIKHNQAKTLLLTSGGMQPMKDEIIKLLQKPAYDVTVAFITTAAKPEENLDYLKRDWNIMRDELGFNVEEVDIEGKKEHEVMKLLELKDIIYVEGGNTFYLLKAMRACNFEKVIRKLLKLGKVYIGSSAGSVVAGRTIRTSGLKTPTDHFGVTNLKGLNLVRFDIFVHYKPEHAEIIKQRFPNQKNRAKNLRILTDEQAILVQGKEVDLIGEGEAIVL